MTDITTHLSLPFLLPNQVQKHVTLNESLKLLDATIQIRIDGASVSSPPGDLVDGFRVTISDEPTDVFAGHAGQIGVYQDGHWAFVTPQLGWLAWFTETAVLQVFEADGWRPIGGTSGGGDILPQLGINASPDSVNRFAIASDAALFNHAGNNHRLVINRASDADTGSLVFQSGFSGRGEVGLMADGGLAARVSSNGTDWRTAWAAEAETGIVKMPGLRSGQIEIDRNAVGSVVPPFGSGFFFVTVMSDTFAKANHAGIFSYDTGASPGLASIALGSNANNLGATLPGGETGPDGAINVSAQTGQLLLENRDNATRIFSYAFLC